MAAAASASHDQAARSASPDKNKNNLTTSDQDQDQDPFVSSSSNPKQNLPPKHHHHHHQRYSIDGTILALGPDTSAVQAKRVLEAHLAETERRMSEAGRLGTALIAQQKELTERLKEVEELQTESELSSELKQKLAEIEKDYNDVARESARAFLPKQRVSSNEAATTGSPFAPNKGGRRSISPSKYESQATGSPTKVTAPNNVNRKLRNQQPVNRVHDIEFAAEISQSLIVQVRDLQSLLAERDEELRDIKVENSRLEFEFETGQQRIKNLDENEQRYKDENWDLETQIQQLKQSQKEASDHEKKLTQTLNLLQAEKTVRQRELDDIRGSHAKLVDEHAAAVKQHDIELGTAKRNIVMAEGEQSALQRKIEDLTAQNTELAKAFSQLQRGRGLDRDGRRGNNNSNGGGLSDDDLDAAGRRHDNNNHTPEHSPPPSPIKAGNTPRHSMLESETLKASLQHAQRTIQSLRTNVHREKTEKLELKRMLQEARDELERTRADLSLSSSVSSAAANNHNNNNKINNRRSNRKTESRDYSRKKTLLLRSSQLGGVRASRTDLYLEDDNPDADPNWEEQQQEAQVHGHLGAVLESTESNSGSSSDHFETANERAAATETEDFHTGAEGFSGDDDDDSATETEASPSSKAAASSSATAANRIKRATPVLPPLQNKHTPGSNNRYSFHSTASTSNDEDDDYSEMKTPTSTGHTTGPNKMRQRLSRNNNNSLSRRSRQVSEEPGFPQGSNSSSSPAASFVHSSASNTPQAQNQKQRPAQSLFAELEDLQQEGSDYDDDDGDDDDEEESVAAATPSRRSISIPSSSMPPLLLPSLPSRKKSIMVDSGTMTEPVEIVVQQQQQEHRPVSVQSVVGPDQNWLLLSAPARGPSASASASTPTLRPASYTSYSDAEAQYDPADMDEKLALFPSPPTTSQLLSLDFSAIESQVVEPVEELPQGQQIEPEPQPLSVSAIMSQHVEPIEVPEPKPEPKPEPPKTPPPPPSSGFFFGIAEDETRQSPSDDHTPLADTPESQRPFKELSANSNFNNKKDKTQQQPQQQQQGKLEQQHHHDLVATSDHGVQTLLTSQEIDNMLNVVNSSSSKAATTTATPGGPNYQRVGSLGSTVTSTIRHHRPKLSLESLASNAAAGTQQPPPPAPAPPPLPFNHREAIEAAAAARSGSANGQYAAATSTAAGSMGPPLYPASAYNNNINNNNKNPLAYRPVTPTTLSRPITPRTARPNTAQSTGTATIYSTPRGAGVGVGPGQGPGPAPGRSRQSSVTSFASEVDARFNMGGGMMMMPPNSNGQGYGYGYGYGRTPTTDPRMIRAITQTMIGEYLWKYTRKAGSREMSDNRHRRYFWLHPYTRTLYWSDRDPLSATKAAAASGRKIGNNGVGGVVGGGGGESHAKSVPIEAVRVVTDDNPMPPGLHRKSLVIVAPGRTIKFTCSTGQRHETWFNALSYLLVRTVDDQDGRHVDTAGVAENMTREDVDEFNPSLTAKLPAAGTRHNHFFSLRPAASPRRSQWNLRSSHDISSSRAASPAPSAAVTLQKQKQQQFLHLHRPHSSQQDRAGPPPSSSSPATPAAVSRSSRLSNFFGSLKGRASTIRLRRSTSATDLAAAAASGAATTTSSSSVYARNREEDDQAHDSAEDLRMMYERQDRESDRLENVRACCDGKHDVGTLVNRRIRPVHGQAHQHAHPPPSSSAQSS